MIWVCWLPPQSQHVMPPAPVPPAAQQLRFQQRAPLRETAWRLRRRRGVSRKVQRTGQGAVGEQSPLQRRGKRAWRARVSPHVATRTLMTVMMILFLSPPQGSEDRGRGVFESIMFLSTSKKNSVWMQVIILHSLVQLKSGWVCRF